MVKNNTKKSLMTLQENTAEDLQLLFQSKDYRKWKFQDNPNILELYLKSFYFLDNYAKSVKIPEQHLHHKKLLSAKLR